MIVLMRQLREELTRALAEHMFHAAEARWNAKYPDLKAFSDLLGEARAWQHYEEVAKDCMDFMYGELGELYPDQPSKSEPSPESAPLPDPQE